MCMSIEPMEFYFFHLNYTSFYQKIELKRLFPTNKSTLILVIVLGLLFKYFSNKKERLSKSTKNGRLRS